MVQQMENAPALAQLTVHMEYVREQINEMAKAMDNMATKEDLAALEERLRKEIDANAPSAIFWAITKTASGIVAIAAAVGVVLAILKVFKV